MGPWVIALVWLVLGPLRSIAQPTEVHSSSYNFSNGVHPTFSVTFDVARTGTVEDHWRGVLKTVSHKVSSRKEMVANTALIPGISPDTMQVLVKAVASKGTGQVVCHVAFFTVHGYVGPTSDPEVITAARKYVRRHSLDLRRSLANAELNAAERNLTRYRRDLATLKRDHERATGQREKSIGKDSSAVAEQARLVGQVAAKDAEVEAFKARMGTSADEETQAELKVLQKQQKKLRNQLASAEKAEASARKRAGSLGATLARNEKTQADMGIKVQRQEALVEELKKKVAEVR